MGKHFADWYIDFIRDALKERKEKIKKLNAELRLFEEEMQRIVTKEMGE